MLRHDGNQFCEDVFALMLANPRVHTLVLSRAPMGRHWPVSSEEHRARVRIFEVRASYRGPHSGVYGARE